jgi:galactitol-specific phosphotransferase system IIB component
MSSSYCTQANIETVYGANNVAKWADIDNDANATTKSTRITYAIDVASEEIDDVLRTSPVRIPIVTAAGATPKTIEHIAAVLAGLWLYEGRGAEDYNRQGTIRHGHAWRRVWARRYLEDIASGKRALDDTIGN